MFKLKTETGTTNDVVALAAALNLSICQIELKNAISSLRKGYHVAVIVLRQDGERSRVAFAEWGQVRGETSRCAIPSKYRDAAGLSVPPEKSASKAAFQIANSIRIQVSRSASWPVEVYGYDGKIVRIDGGQEWRETLAELKSIAAEKQAARDAIRKAKGLETSAERKARLAANRPKRQPSAKALAAAQKRAKRAADRGLKMIQTIRQIGARKKRQTILAIKATMKPVPKLRKAARATIHADERARLEAEIAQRRKVAIGMISAVLQSQDEMIANLQALKLDGFTFRPASQEQRDSQIAELRRLIDPPAMIEKERKAAEKAAAKAEREKAKAEKARQREVARLQRELDRAKKGREKTQAKRAKEKARDEAKAKRMESAQKKRKRGTSEKVSKFSPARRFFDDVEKLDSSWNPMRNGVRTRFDIEKDSPFSVRVKLRGVIDDVPVHADSELFHSGLDRLDDGSGSDWTRNIRRDGSRKPVPHSVARKVHGEILDALRYFDALTKRETTRNLGIARSVITGERVQVEANPHSIAQLEKMASHKSVTARGTLYSGKTPGGKPWEILAS